MVWTLIDDKSRIGKSKNGSWVETNRRQTSRGVQKSDGYVRWNKTRRKREQTIASHGCWWWQKPLKCSDVKRKMKILTNVNNIIQNFKETLLCSYCFKYLVCGLVWSSTILQCFDLWLYFKFRNISSVTV